MVQTKPNIKYTCEYGYPRIPPPPSPALFRARLFHILAESGFLLPLLERRSGFSSLPRTGHRCREPRSHVPPPPRPRSSDPRVTTPAQISRAGRRAGLRSVAPGTAGPARRQTGSASPPPPPSGTSEKERGKVAGGAEPQQGSAWGR